MTTPLPTDWDLKVIEDIRSDIIMIQKAIGDSAYNDMVRLPIGDSRPQPVYELKAIADRKRDEIRAIERQFPEYFCL